MIPANLRLDRKVAKPAARQRWQIRSNTNLTRLHCPQARLIWAQTRPLRRLGGHSGGLRTVRGTPHVTCPTPVV